jgi:hypothetical protein
MNDVTDAEIQDEIKIMGDAYEGFSRLSHRAQSRALEWLTARLESDWRKAGNAKAG